MHDCAGLDLAVGLALVDSSVIVTNLDDAEGPHSIGVAHLMCRGTHVSNMYSHIQRAVLKCILPQNP